MLRIFVSIIFLTSVVSTAFAAEDPALVNEKDRISYSIGYQVGGDFRRQQLEILPEPLLKGLTDALNGNEPAMTGTEMRDALRDLQRIVTAKREEQMNREAEKNREMGEAFLAANATKDGVIVLPSGLQYKVIEQGSGKKPAVTDSVSVHYRGRLIDGTEFDSSYSRNQPATFKVGGVIRGWTEALQLMQEGAKWELYVPSELAYRQAGAGQKIGPNSTLIFEVELLAVQ